jgi:SAM-dependent methyltransferase
MVAPIDHFANVARHYARSRPGYPEALFDWLAASSPARRMAWDAGAGSGQATLALAARFEHVLATDSSAEQIAQARVHAKVEYRVAPAHESGLSGQCVDLVSVAQALHWFDVEKFHAEACRVMVPGGLIAQWSYGVVEVEGAAVNAIVQDFYWNVLGAHWPAERRHVENGYADLEFPFRRIATPIFAMRLHWNLAEILGYVRSWSATARCRATTGLDPVEALRETLMAVWGQADTPREITWPLALRVGFA